MPKEFDPNTPPFIPSWKHQPQAQGADRPTRTYPPLPKRTPQCLSFLPPNSAQQLTGETEASFPFPLPTDHDYAYMMNGKPVSPGIVSTSATAGAAAPPAAPPAVDQPLQPTLSKAQDPKRRRQEKKKGRPEPKKREQADSDKREDEKTSEEEQPTELPEGATELVPWTDDGDTEEAKEEATRGASPEDDGTRDSIDAVTRILGIDSPNKGKGSKLAPSRRPIGKREGHFDGIDPSLDPRYWGDGYEGIDMDPTMDPTGNGVDPMVAAAFLGMSPEAMAALPNGGPGGMMGLQNYHSYLMNQMQSSDPSVAAAAAAALSFNPLLSMPPAMNPNLPNWAHHPQPRLPGTPGGSTTPATPGVMSAASSTSSLPAPNSPSTPSSTPDRLSSAPSTPNGQGPVSKPSLAPGSGSIIPGLSLGLQGQSAPSPGPSLLGSDAVKLPSPLDPLASPSMASPSGGSRWPPVAPIAPGNQISPTQPPQPPVEMPQAWGLDALQQISISPQGHLSAVSPSVGGGSGSSAVGSSTGSGGGRSGLAPEVDPALFYLPSNLDD